MYIPFLPSICSGGNSSRELPRLLANGVPLLAKPPREPPLPPRPPLLEKPPRLEPPRPLKLMLVFVCVCKKSFTRTTTQFFAANKFFMQREKIGNANINWQEAAFGVGKNRRKTIGFGKCIKKKYECEFFIRELSIVEAGMFVKKIASLTVYSGCAIWDAAIVMSRWMYENGAVLFANQVILELGAGVGLPGILASRYASHVYLTDYMQTLLDNLRYNVTLNTNIDEDEDAPTLQQCKQYMQAHSSVKYLNWDEIAGMPLDLAKDDILPQERLDPIAPQSIDILLGSELTYTACTSTIDNLCKVVDYFLKPGMTPQYIHTNTNKVVYL